MEFLDIDFRGPSYSGALIALHPGIDVSRTAVAVSVTCLGDFVLTNSDAWV